MWIELQIPAHLRKKAASNLFLSILQRGEFSAEVQAAMAAFTFISHKFAIYFLVLRQILYSPLEFRALHSSIFGQICPNVKAKKRGRAPPINDPAGHSFRMSQ